jgi:hypothetical protein
MDYNAVFFNYNAEHKSERFEPFWNVATASVAVCYPPYMYA